MSRLRLLDLAAVIKALTLLGWFFSKFCTPSRLDLSCRPSAPAARVPLHAILAKCTANASAYYAPTHCFIYFGFCFTASFLSPCSLSLCLFSFCNPVLSTDTTLGKALPLVHRSHYCRFMIGHCLGRIERCVECQLLGTINHKLYIVRGVRVCTVMVAYLRSF